VYSLSLAGHFVSNDSAFRLEAKSLRLQGESPLPNLTANGTVALGKNLSMSLHGELAQWPKDWPALPAPLNASKGALPVQLAYEGKPDFSDVLSLESTLGETRFHANLRVPEMQTWLSIDNAAPLPPLTGTLTSPQLNIDGVDLKGVSVEIEDDLPAAPAPTKP
jgi:hypothetical protein